MTININPFKHSQTQSSMYFPCFLNCKTEHNLPYIHHQQIKHWSTTNKNATYIIVQLKNLCFISICLLFINIHPTLLLLYEKVCLFFKSSICLSRINMSLYCTTKKDCVFHMTNSLMDQGKMI